MEQTGIIPNAFKVITNKITNKKPRVAQKDGHESPAESCENKPQYIRYLQAVENEIYDYEDIPSVSDNEDIIIDNENEIDVLEDNLYSGSTNYSHYTSRSIQTINTPTTKPIVQHQSKLTQTKYELLCYFKFIRINCDSFFQIHLQR